MMKVRVFLDLKLSEALVEVRVLITNGHFQPAELMLLSIINQVKQEEQSKPISNSDEKEIKETPNG